MLSFVGRLPEKLMCSVLERLFIVGHFVIGPEVQYGLTRLTKPGSDHNTTYALTLGYRF